MAARQRSTAVEHVECEGIYEKATGVVSNEEYLNKNVSELRMESIISINFSNYTNTQIC